MLSSRKWISKMTIVLVTFCLALMPLESRSQAQGDEEAEKGSDIFQESLTDLYVITALGAAGGILGLSTLSFVDKPSKHIKNIWVGGALGIIVGVGVVAWRQATKSQPFYTSTTQINYLNNEIDRPASRDSFDEMNDIQNQPLTFNFAFDF